MNKQIDKTQDHTVSLCLWLAGYGRWAPGQAGKLFQTHEGREASVGLSLAGMKSLDL